MTLRTRGLHLVVLLTAALFLAAGCKKSQPQQEPEKKAPAQEKAAEKAPAEKPAEPAEEPAEEPATEPTEAAAVPDVQTAADVAAEAPAEEPAAEEPAAEEPAAEEPAAEEPAAGEPAEAPAEEPPAEEAPAETDVVTTDAAATDAAAAEEMPEGHFGQPFKLDAVMMVADVTKYPEHYATFESIKLRGKVLAVKDGQVLMGHETPEGFFVVAARLSAEAQRDLEPGQTVQLEGKMEPQDWSLDAFGEIDTAGKDPAVAKGYVLSVSAGEVE